jgi:organic radical activating enzyme
MSDDQSEYGFGWENFSLVSKESKEEYLFLLLIENLNIYNKCDSIFYKSSRKIGGDSDWHCRPIFYKTENKFVLNLNPLETQEYISKVLKEDFKTFGFDKLFSTYEYLIEKHSENYEPIDHQSVIRFPKDSTGKIHVGFAKDLISFIISNEFAILGGNDNDCDDNEYSQYDDGHALINLLSSSKYDDMTIVYDFENGDYVLQNQNKGTIIRFSFENNYETKKSEFPTLVDISITSFCDKGCKFCYQSSTKSGTHSDVEFVKTVLNELKSKGCLEVVFGGGEPSTHPQFLEIVKHAKSLNLVVGVTTKNQNFLTIPKSKEVLENINSLAFSCNNNVEAKQAIDLFDKISDDNRKIAFYFQTILGLNSLDSLCDMVEFIKNDGSYFSKNLTLLGYKDFGFGKNQQPHDVDGWIERIKESIEDEYDQMSVGIDSIVVKKWKEQLIESGVDYRNLVGEEGKFSCYIDCVEKTIASSSFTDTKFDFDSNWLSTFKSF